MALDILIQKTHIFTRKNAGYWIYLDCFELSFGGSGEIRTHERDKPSPVFKTGAFNHSATLPSGYRQMNCIGPIKTLLHGVCKLSATMFINFQEIALYPSLSGMPTAAR